MNPGPRASRGFLCRRYGVSAELGVPAGDFRWSLAVRDKETGLTSFLLLLAKP
jgi:hypothetical protein